MGVGGNARKRGECQAGQCLIRVSGNWNEIGSRWKVDGKKLDKLCGVEGTVRGRQ